MAAMVATFDFWSEHFWLFLIYVTQYFLYSFESFGLSVQEKKLQIDFKTATVVAILDFWSEQL